MGVSCSEPKFSRRKPASRMKSCSTRLRDSACGVRSAQAAVQGRCRRVSLDAPAAAPAPPRSQYGGGRTGFTASNLVRLKPTPWMPRARSAKRALPTGTSSYSCTTIRPLSCRRRRCRVADCVLRRELPRHVSTNNTANETPRLFQLATGQLRRCPQACLHLAVDGHVEEDASAALCRWRGRRRRRALLPCRRRHRRSAVLMPDDLS